MSDRVLIYIHNEEPFVADLEAMPAPDATWVYLTNPRTREGRPVALNAGASKGMLIPLARISRIEFIVSERDKWDIEYFSRNQAKS